MTFDEETNNRLTKTFNDAVLTVFYKTVVPCKDYHQPKSWLNLMHMSEEEYNKKRIRNDIIKCFFYKIRTNGWFEEYNSTITIEDMFDIGKNSLGNFYCFPKTEIKEWVNIACEKVDYSFENEWYEYHQDMAYEEAKNHRKGEYW